MFCGLRGRFRCRTRADKCMMNGCKPYKYPLSRARFACFLKRFDAPDASMRYTSDAWDLQIVKNWDQAARKAYGVKTAMMGLIVLAHFKSIRTWGHQ